MRTPMGLRNAGAEKGQGRRVRVRRQKALKKRTPRVTCERRKEAVAQSERGRSPKLEELPLDGGFPDVEVPSDVGGKRCLNDVEGHMSG